jgi:hypothetical protein
VSAWLIAAILTFAPLLQSSQPSSSNQKKAGPPPPITIVGCVGGGASPGAPLTITSLDRTVMYKLAGMNMRRYIGQRVSIVGTSDSKKVKIVGGLVPSPNAAAQAGALDPAKAAIAAEPLSTAAKQDQTLPEFKVKSVQTLQGGCE